MILVSPWRLLLVRCHRSEEEPYRRGHSYLSKAVGALEIFLRTEGYNRGRHRASYHHLRSSRQGWHCQRWQCRCLVFCDTAAAGRGYSRTQQRWVRGQDLCSSAYCASTTKLEWSLCECCE